MARLVLVTGQKGGVGKTLFARALATWLDRQSVPWVGIDTDPANPTFAHQGGTHVVSVPLYDRSGYLVPAAINHIVDDLVERAESDETIVLDMGAGQLTAIFEGFRARRLLGSQSVLPVTLAYLIHRDPASVSTLAQVVDIADDVSDVAWLIVRNERDGPVRQYDGSATQAELAKRRAAEMSLPALRDHLVFDALDESHLTMEQFLDKTLNPAWSLRNQFWTWFADTSQALSTVASVLVAPGADSVPAFAPTVVTATTPADVPRLAS